jgi:hypothetical protein
MGPRQVWRDLGRSVRGVVAFRRYMCSRDTVDIALGLFEAASSTVMAGHLCRYVVRIANLSEKAVPVQVIIQISSMSAANVPAPPSVNFGSHCTVPPRRAMALEWHYDWRNTVVLLVDQMASPPDTFWIGEVPTGQRYIVSAILSDHAGTHLDQLDIYQELLG